MYYNGTCDILGDCICNQSDLTGYWQNDGDNECNICVDDYYPATGGKVYCSDSQNTCGNHGVCNTTDGSCICDYNDEKGYWIGDRCNKYEEDYYGADCKIKCIKEDTYTDENNVGCNNKGVCDSSSGFVFVIMIQ